MFFYAGIEWDEFVDVAVSLAQRTHNLLGLLVPCSIVYALPAGVSHLPYQYRWPH